MLEDQNIDRAEIELELERILESDGFKASPRICAFLRFVVEETLSGRGARLKAFTIATIVYNKTADFNPQSNPLVRVEALRLRRLLERYYSGEGERNPIRVQMRKGGYMPVFAREIRRIEEPSVAAAPVGGDEAARFARRRPSLVWWPAAFALFLAASAGAIGGWVYRQGHGAADSRAADSRVSTYGATIAVGPFELSGNSPGSAEFGKYLTHGVEDVLSRFENPIVVRGEAGAGGATTYRLTGELRASPPGAAVLSTRVIHVPSGEVIMSKSFADLPIDDAAKSMAAINAVAGQLAEVYDTIHGDEHKRAAPFSDATLGRDCVVYAYGVINTPAPETYANAKGCLERTIAANPAYASAHFAYAFLQVSSYVLQINTGPGDNPLEGALDAAREGVSLSPQTGQSHAALFWARFFDNRFDDAFDSAKLAMELNPYSNEIMARVGAARILQGEFAKGAELMRAADRLAGYTAGWREFYIFLAAHMIGDKEAAWRHAYRRGAAWQPLGQIARIISSNEKGDSAGVLKWRQRLAHGFPTFAGDISASLRRMAMTPGIKSRLLADLDAAGGVDFTQNAIQ